MTKVTFLPDHKEIEIKEKTLLLDALEEAGINIDTPCGGKGICGKCKVVIKNGITPVNDIEKKFLTREEMKNGFRLACQARIFQDTIVEIPSEIRLDFKRVYAAYSKGDIHPTGNQFSLESGIKKVFITLEKPSLDDQRSDLERIKDKLSFKGISNATDIRIPIEVLKKIPVLIREAGFKLTVSLCGDEIIAVEKDDTTKNLYGIAFDIGTTTIAGYLVDLRTGEELSILAKTNPQIIHGDDVISRIGYAQLSKDNQAKLQKEIIITFNEILGEATLKAGIEKDNIYEMAVVGNTCMHHLFLGIDPVYLGPTPYIPVVRELLCLKGKDIPELDLSSNAPIYLLPNISAFVGADISAGILSTSLWKEDKTILFVDLGTNGEVVIASRRRLWACSTAAGPAFEGARIQAGMRAATGAIYKVSINQDTVLCKVIEDGKPRGICGSGLIDLIAELLRLGLIDRNGRLIHREECPAEVDEHIRKRIIHGQKGNKFLLAERDQTASGRSLFLTQKDIREVQLAKAAIYAGIRILLKEINVTPDYIQEILLAGAFGNYIDKKSAVRIGLLPDIPLTRIESVGNAAGRGAEMALCSKKEREIAEQVTRKVKYIELSSRTDFQEEFMQGLFFKGSFDKNRDRV